MHERSDHSGSLGVGVVEEGVEEGQHTVSDVEEVPNLEGKLLPEGRWVLGLQPRTSWKEVVVIKSGR